MEDNCAAAHGTQIIHCPGLTYGQPLAVVEVVAVARGPIGCAYNSAGST